MLLLPPIRRVVYTITHIGLSAGMRAVMIIALFFVGGYTFIPTVQEEIIQHTNTQREAELRQSQQTRSLPGTQDTTQLLSANDVQKLFDETRALAEKRNEEHMPSKAQPVADFHSNVIVSPAQPHIAVKRTQDDVRRDEILETLKNVPAQNYTRRLDLYRELLATAPNEEAVLENLPFYEQQYAEQLSRKPEEGAQRRKKKSENAIAKALASWAPLSVSQQDSQVTVVTKDPSVAEETYFAMLQNICMFTPESLHGVSNVSFLNRFSYQGLVFEGGEPECREYLRARDRAIWVRGITRRALH